MPNDISSRYGQNNIQTTTQAPGAGFAGAQLGGLNLDSLTRYYRQLAAYQQAKQARAEAQQQQLAERQMRLQEAGDLRAANEQAFQQQMARDQYEALQQQDVPIYRPFMSGGAGYTGGYGQASTVQLPGAAAAGYVPASQAAQYALPNSAGFSQYQPTPESPTTAGVGQTPLGSGGFTLPASQQLQALTSGLR